MNGVLSFLEKRLREAEKMRQIEICLKEMKRLMSLMTFLLKVEMDSNELCLKTSA